MKPATATVRGRHSDRIEIPAGHGWLGIPSALAAFAANVGLFAARRPGTPLRVLSLMAIDAALRSRGIIITADRRQAVIEVMELGALLNDRFDGDAHDPRALRASVTWFERSEHREVIWSYAKRLRRLERTRPDPGQGTTAVMRYRESVNRVSLAVLWALARGRALAAAEMEIAREADLCLLFQIVMQTQLIDDVLDVRHDRRRGLPSFANGPEVTAASLCELVSAYSDSTPIGFNRNFYLQVTLKMMAAVSRAWIAIRPAAFF
ncbi:MAG: hypothetical protein V4819_23220 [Verrucomicrobiota bacterium]